MARRIGVKIHLGQTPLGKGAFGSVYQCTDEYKTELAVKCIPLDKDGIPCLMEASIMSMMNHPYLNQALRIHVDEKKLYIVQECAISDLSRLARTKTELKSGSPSPDLLRKWTYALVKATAALHRQNIIHADIKASNVLLFADNIVRLADFTVAVKKWHPGSLFRHTVCTATHRPLEIWLGRDWDQSIDLWSLGCTLYEIAYGELLFPYQATSAEMSETQIRDRSINSLLDWGERNPGGQEKVVVPKRNCEFIPFRLPAKFHDPAYAEFNDLILSMLRLNPTERPTIEQLLSHSYFRSITSPCVTFPMESVPVPDITSQLRHRLTRHLTKYTTSKEIIGFSLELYGRSQFLTIDKKTTVTHPDIADQRNDERLRILTCLWISSKLINRIPINLGDIEPKVLMWERLICKHLKFQLLTSENILFIINDNTHGHPVSHKNSSGT